MDYKNLGICIFLMTLGAGCAKEDVSNPISYEVIVESQLSYSDAEKIPKQYLVFENEAAWNDFIPEIERVNPSHGEGLRNLDFDFSNNNLIIIIGKHYNYCCSTISVHGVFKQNEDIVVQFTESGTGGYTALSQAYMLLKISKEEAD